MQYIQWSLRLLFWSKQNKTKINEIIFILFLFSLPALIAPRRMLSNALKIAMAKESAILLLENAQIAMLATMEKLVTHVRIKAIAKNGMFPMDIVLLRANIPPILIVKINLKILNQ